MCNECFNSYPNCPVCSEDETRTVICPTCFGVKTYVSDCCGAKIDTDTLLCHECHDHAEIEEWVCDRCKGEGVILEPIEN